MAKGNMLLGYSRGKVGDLVFKRQNGHQVTAPYVKPRNANTRAQAIQRSQLSNIVAIYRAGIALLNHSFTSKPSNRSSYNEFVSKNLNSVKVYLTKEMSAANAAVVAPYMISDGSLPSIQISGVGVDAVTNIAVGQLTIDGSTTIAALSQALVANNANIEMGMQLSYVSAVQSTNAETGFPSVEFALYEITLSDSVELVSDYLPEQSYAVRGGFLAHGDLVADGGFAWILSKKDAQGKLIASPQRLIVTSVDLYAAYSGNAAATRAAVSFNAAEESFLTPGGNSASGSSSQVKVSSARFGSNTLVAGTGSYSLGSAGSNKSITLIGSNMEGVTGGSVSLTGVSSDGSGQVTATADADVVATANQVALSFQVPSELANKYLTAVNISLVPGGSFVWNGNHEEVLDPLG